MAIKQNIIFPWIGTHAGIPSNWTRETSLDDTYAKAWGAEAPNTTGGSASHTHTSPSHTHAMDSHTHTVTPNSGNSESGSTANDGTEKNTGNGPHTHGTSTSEAPSSVSVSSTAVTYGSCSNDPPYYAVIFIKSQGGAVLPNDILTYWNSTTIPSGWYLADGSNATVDLRNKYLKGASTGADAGGTGGSLNNTHDISHTHTVSHVHLGSTGARQGGSPGLRTNGLSSPQAMDQNHAHSMTLNTASETIGGTTSLVTSETVEPVYKKLAVIQKKASGIQEKGIIGLWLGSTSSLPTGWKLCDGTNGTPDMRDKFIKCANDTSEIGNTGGANTHAHATQTHTHTASSSHSHTVTIDQGSRTWLNIGSGHNFWIPHTHTSPDSSTATTSLSASSTTADSSANTPPYRTVAYIQYKGDAGGAFIFNLLN